MKCSFDLTFLPEWTHSFFRIWNASSREPISGSFALWLWKSNILGKIPKWSPTDIDIFTTNAQETAIDIMSHIPDKGIINVRNRDKIIEINVMGIPSTLQIIENSENITEILKTFDLSICQVALVWKNGLTFKFGDDEVKVDIVTNVSRCFIDMKNSNEKHKKRIEKYSSRGYRIIQAQIREKDFYYYPSQSVDTNSCAISIEKFDPTCISFGEIITKEVKDEKTGKLRFRFTTCPVRYIKLNSDIDDLLFETPRCSTPGLRKDVYTNKLLLKIDITDEDKYIKFLDKLRECVYGYFTQTKNMDYLSKNCRIAHMYLSSGIVGIKKPYVQDTNYSPNIFQYIRLGENCIFENLYENQSPKNYIGVQGSVSCVLKLTEIYFGAHGGSPVGISLKFDAVKCDFLKYDQQYY